MLRKSFVRIGAGLAGVLAAGLIAGPASAHVTVNPGAASQGGYTKLTFRVPNERPDAATTAVAVSFPAATPIASVSVKPIAGWVTGVTSSKLATPIKTDDGEITEAVSTIVWTANRPDAAIAPGQFQEFEVSGGPLPAVDQLVFKVLQTYSDGEVVRWIEEPAAGKEAEHPAPVLKLTRGTESGDGMSVSAGASGGRDDLALGLAVGALVLALAGTVLAALAYRRRGVVTAGSSGPAGAR